MASINLNNDSRIPVIGLGTWQSKPGEVEAAVKVAIEAGYRLIDCAYVYGNESEVGEAIKEVIDQGTVKREELFIVSKFCGEAIRMAACKFQTTTDVLWNTRHHKEDVKPSLLESLKSLRLDYIDLYLIHWPMSFKQGDGLFPKDSEGNLLYDDVSYLETWKALEECVDEGLIKHIGLSNFNSKQTQDVIDHARIKPFALQVEVHPSFNQEKLVNFCHERNIVVMAYSCLGAPARPWAQTDGHTQLPLDDAVIGTIANRLGRTPAQVILRWAIQRKTVPIPKSVTPSRIHANFSIFDFELSAEDMNAINGVDRNLRLLVPVVVKNGVKEYRDKDAPNFPFLIDF